MEFGLTILTTLFLFLLPIPPEEEKSYDLAIIPVAGEVWLRTEVYDVNLNVPALPQEAQKYQVTNKIREKTLEVAEDGSVTSSLVITDSKVDFGKEMATQYNLFDLINVPITMTLKMPEKLVTVEAEGDLSPTALTKLDDYRQQQYNQLLTLPTREKVKVGDTWTSEHTLSQQGPGRFSDALIKHTYTFVGPIKKEGRTLLKITMKGTMTTVTMGSSNGTLETELEGTLLIDPETRQFASVHNAAHQTGVLELQDGKMPVDARVSVLITYRRENDELSLR